MAQQTAYKFSFLARKEYSRAQADIAVLPVNNEDNSIRDLAKAMKQVCSAEQALLKAREACEKAYDIMPSNDLTRKWIKNDWEMARFLDQCVEIKKN